MARVRSNRVCFTLNNYNDEDVEKIKNLENNNDVVYMVVGEEVGENGTPHLQGFIHMKMDPKLGGIKFWKDFFKFSQAAHYENARGTDEQSKEYCTKSGPYFEKGEPSATSATIWHALFEQATVDANGCREISPELPIKHWHALVSIQKRYEPAGTWTDVTELRPWQAKVWDLLQAQNNRQVLFVVDETGNTGKTSLGGWLTHHHNAWLSTGKLP